MPFYRVNGITVHMRGTKLPPACVAIVGIGDQRQRCAGISSAFCDWPTDGGRSLCSRALCAAHANEVGRNKHYCPEHLAEHVDNQVQPGLFTGLLEDAS